MPKGELTQSRIFLFPLLLLPIEKDVIYWKLADTFLARRLWLLKKQYNLFFILYCERRHYSSLECKSFNPYDAFDPQIKKHSLQMNSLQPAVFSDFIITSSLLCNGKVIKWLPNTKHASGLASTKSHESGRTGSLYNHRMVWLARDL